MCFHPDKNKTHQRPECQKPDRIPSSIIHHNKNHDSKALKKLILNWSRRKYWCKSEYEILVGDLSCKASEKIDAFRQIEMNIDRITEYVNKELDLF